MEIASIDEMRELERKSNEIYMDENIMMEHAAFSIYLAIEEEIGNLKGKSAIVFAGKGNNGGDALALVRNLHEAGMNVKVCLVFGEVSSKLAMKNLSILKRMGIDIVDEVQEDEIRRTDVVVDGIFGIGFKSRIDEKISKMIDKINACSNFKVSIDVPSGIDADTGQVIDKSVIADMTVTLGLIKRGMLFHPAKALCGRIKIGKIGIPPNILGGLKGEVITFSDAKSMLPKRPAFSNKGTFGRIIVIAGSKNYTGTPALVALGALRSGAGLVRVASVSSHLTTFIPEAISIPLEMENEEISVKNIPILDELISKSDIVAIGPGLGTGKNVKEIVNHTLEWKDKVLVIDADGINSLSGNFEFPPKAIITPHPGEFARLTNKNLDEILFDPLKCAMDFSKSNNVITLLKGPTTVITRPDGRYAVNVTGNSALAKGGSGDILTGMIAGFAAQGMDLFDAAKLSVFVHGRAAEIYSQQNGEYSMLAREIGEWIPRILRELSDP